MQVAQGRTDQTLAIIFSADETADVGFDLSTPMAKANGTEVVLRFSCKVISGTVAVEQDRSERGEAFRHLPQRVPGTIDGNTLIMTIERLSALLKLAT